ncbi:MAG: hypothetical protein KF789_02460 [Bdellovibrionaceae bacterium]|nr:hypothetical protein [Pseudobdellovibrionaceae bacterium]
MKFSSAVDSLTKENLFLRTAVKILGFAVLFLTMAVLFLHDKSPVVVERSSRGMEIVQMTKLARSEADIQQAIRLMLIARFDSGAVNADVFLSKRQMELREAEQKEMKARGLYQGVVFRSAKVTKEEAFVEFDRVLSVGEIRSALKTVVKVAFEEVDPTELNPYGLKLALAAPTESKKEDKR